MENPPSVNRSENSEQQLFDRLECTLQDPRAIATMRRALEIEEATNGTLASEALDLEDLRQRLYNHIHSLNRRWPHMDQPVVISGWVSDKKISDEDEMVQHNVTDMDVKSIGFDYRPTLHTLESGKNILQLESLLAFAYTDAQGEEQSCYARPGFVHIEPMYQSIDHSESILFEHYPGVVRDIHDRLADIDPTNDMQVIDAFKDFMLPVDSDPEIDAQMREAIETYLLHQVEFESSLPCYVIARGNYYQEVYKKGEGVAVKKRTSESRHENIGYIDKVTFRTSIEEDGLRMHIPVLQMSLHGKEKNSLGYTRQYPLRTIENIVSVRDIAYKSINRGHE